MLLCLWPWNHQMFSFTGWRDVLEEQDECITYVWQQKEKKVHGNWPPSVCYGLLCQSSFGLSGIFCAISEVCISDMYVPICLYLLLSRGNQTPLDITSLSELKPHLHHRRPSIWHAVLCGDGFDPVVFKVIVVISFSWFLSDLQVMACMTAYIHTHFSNGK
jgi:hypothetical protein